MSSMSNSPRNMHGGTQISALNMNQYANMPSSGSRNESMYPPAMMMSSASSDERNLHGYPGHPNVYDASMNHMGVNHTGQEMWNPPAGAFAAAIANQAPDYPHPHPHQRLSHSPTRDSRTLDETMPPPSRISDSHESRRQSLQVHDLMGSMSKLRTGDRQDQRGYHDSIDSMGHSTDTMGTIEPLPVREHSYGAGAGASLSMSSGTFSLMKGLADSGHSSKLATSSSIIKSESIDAKPSPMSSSGISPSGASDYNSSQRPRRRSERKSIHIDQEGFFDARRPSSIHDASMTLSMVLDTRRIDVTQAISEDPEAEASEGGQEIKGKATGSGVLVDEPDTMSSLDRSSMDMSILHLAMGEDSGLTVAHDSTFSDYLGD